MPRIAGCARLSRKRYCIDDMRGLAAERGGHCLSAQYISADTHLRWRCARGHEWNASPGNVRAGTWCPECCKTGASAGERICREILRHMFGRPFIKCRPQWLISDQGNLLELDGLAEPCVANEQPLAFEYQGNQHYGVVGRAASRDRLLRQQERDALKRRLCWEQGVCLIVVPAFVRLGDLSGCIDQVEASVLFAGVVIPRKWKRPSELPAVWRPLEWALGGTGRVELLRATALARGGELLSVSAVGARDRLRWRCRMGHEWGATARNVLSNRSWCPVCAENHPGTIESLRAVAIERGGQCLSTGYVGSQQKHAWCCSLGHVWEAIANNVVRGSWCPVCAWAVRSAKLKGRRVGGAALPRKAREGVAP